jgi:Family of unknown function (DUF6879)
LELVSSKERDGLLANFEREALHLELRDVYAIDDEGERLARFLERGYRDHDAEAEERQSWMTLVRDATLAGKMFKRVRVISEPVTDYIRYEWAGTGANIDAGEEAKWLPRRMTSTIPLPGNDFWIFDESIVIFTVFTGKGDVFERQLTTDSAVVQLCRSAFESTWTIAIPHSEYRPS